MGLLSLFRHSNTNTNSNATPTSASTSNVSPSPHTTSKYAAGGDSESGRATPLGTLSTSTTTPTPTTPTSSVHLNTPILESPKADFLRPIFPPSSPSSSSITSRLTRKPWKRTASNAPGQEKGKAKDKGKSKGKEKAAVTDTDTEETIGIAYEDTSPPLPPPLGGPRYSHSAPATPQTSTRSSSIFPDGQHTGSPLITSTSLSTMLLSDREEELNDDSLDSSINEDAAGKTLRDARVNSGQFKQEGGILGKLNFEFDGLGTSPPEKWINRGGQSNITSASAVSNTQTQTISDVSYETPMSLQDTPETMPASETVASVVQDDVVGSVNNEREDQQTPTQASKVPGAGSHAEEEKMEMLESAEKKTKFWKRPRRPSRDVNDVVPEIDRSGSPTPRKPPAVTVPEQVIPRTSLDVQPVRPPQLRRPSSSLFHNPFTRSVSRSSLALDLDRPTVDDGSFQLRGFRHVSGTMDTEGAGDLENYLSHVRGDRRPSASTDALLSPGLGDVPSPPSAFVTRARPSTIAISRPPSIANSLASAAGDEFPIPTSRVSVAAFRKGIRRPSEGVLTTMSDIGHSGGVHHQGFANGQQSPLNAGGDGDDEDDDLPLGMLNKRKELGREQSSQSLSSLRGSSGPTYQNQMTPPLTESINRKPSPVVMGDRTFTPSPIPAHETPSSRKASPALGVGDPIARRPSPNPSLSFTVQRHKRNGGGSGGFVVKSTRLTRDDLLPRTFEGPSGGLGPPVFKTPPVSGRSTPLPSGDHVQDVGEADDKREYQNSALSTSPEEINVVDGYFSSIAPLITDYSDQHPSAPKNKPGFHPSGRSVSAPQRPLSPAHAPGPPIVPITLPQPGDKTPGSLKMNLPLPPDQMPDTPPKSPGELPTSPMSPGTRKRLSLLDEPMRIISGLWNSPSSGADGFDPALVVSSMDAFGDEGLGLKQPPTTTTHEERSLEHQSSHTTLFDLGKITPGIGPEERVRSPLSDRLAGITSSALLGGTGTMPHKPSLARLNTAGNGGKGDRDPSQLKEDINGHAQTHIRSPISDPTASPTISTVPPPAPPQSVTASASATRTAFASSFSRAQPRRAKKDSSSDESDTEETSGSTPQAQHGILAKVSGQSKAQEHSRNGGAVGAAGLVHSPSRKVPSGPRKPSTSNRKRVSSNRSVPSPSSPRRPQSTFVSTQPKRTGAGAGADRRNHRHDDSKGKEDNSGSEDDAPLGILRNKASRSTLSVDKHGLSPTAQTHQHGLPRTESTSGQTISTSQAPGRAQGQIRSPALRGNLIPSPAAQERRKTLVELGPISQPLRDRSFDHGSQVAQDQIRPRPSSRSRASSSSVGGNRGTRYSPGKTLIQLPPSDGPYPPSMPDRQSRPRQDPNPAGQVRNKTASPASSRSATTGGSGAYQPMTPKEGNDGPNSKTLDQTPTTRKRVISGPPIHNALQVEGGPGAFPPAGEAGLNPQARHQRAPSMYDQGHTGPMAMDPQSINGTSPDAMRAMMKQQWQLQFMAAAYRASEDEWERQSSVSAHTNHTTPASFGSQYPNMGMGMGMPMGMPHMPMGYGMGMQYPNTNLPYGYQPQPMQGFQGQQGPGYGMFPTQHSNGYPMPPQSSYGGGGGGGGSMGGGGGGGMYSYGAGARSVFGGEFGPPPLTPSGRFPFQSNANSNSLEIPQHHSSPQSTVGSQPQLKPRRGSASGTRSLYAASIVDTPVQGRPPSSWNRRNGSTSGSGDWSDLTQGQGQGQSPGGAGGMRVRPQTHYAN